MNDHYTADDWECSYNFKDILSKHRFTILYPLFSNDNANSWQKCFNAIRCTSNECEIFPKFIFSWLRLNLSGISDPTVGPLFPKSRKVDLFFSQCIWYLWFLWHQIVLQQCSSMFCNALKSLIMLSDIHKFSAKLSNFSNQHDSAFLALQ